MQNLSDADKSYATFSSSSKFHFRWHIYYKPTIKKERKTTNTSLSISFLFPFFKEEREEREKERKRGRGRIHIRRRTRSLAPKQDKCVDDSVKWRRNAILYGVYTVALISHAILIRQKLQVRTEGISTRGNGKPKPFSSIP